MYEISIKSHFSSAHQLRDYPGDCERLHGHNYGLEVVCRCQGLDALGMGIDFKILKSRVNEVISQLDHYNLNDKSFFKEINPSAENIASWIYRELNSRLKDENAKVYRVNLWETDTCMVSYFED